MINFNIFYKFSLIFQANKSYQQGCWQLCITLYAKLLLAGFSLNAKHTHRFNRAKQQFQTFKKQTNTSKKTFRKIAVCGWDLSHNAAGRVLTLAQLYEYAGCKVSIIGCVISKNRDSLKDIWEPMRLSGYNSDYIDVFKVDDLLPKAFEFVINNPFDIVHLSKPRLPNIIFGKLYQLIWDAHVILDIDDEELGFAKYVDNNTERLLKSASRKQLLNIRHDYWTNKCVSLSKSFHNLSISNVALQEIYGGTVIPHVRDERVFMFNNNLKQTMRKQYDIPKDNMVVLFFGTPKPHKGVLETAKAISQLNKSDVSFVIIGDFIDENLKNNIQSIQNVNLHLMPNQAYQDIHKFVAMGDVTVLMQRTGSLVTDFQLPAKLIDALAMGLMVIVSETKALQPIIKSGSVLVATQDDLGQKLSECYNNLGFNKVGNDYFKHELSMSANKEKLLSLIDIQYPKHYAIKANTRYTIETLLDEGLFSVKE